MITEQQIKEIPFNGCVLLGVRDDQGQIWLGVRKACLDIGLNKNQADRQVKNIQSDIVLNKGSSNLTIPTRGGNQTLLAIKEEFVTLWLAKMPLTPTMKRIDQR